MQLQSYLIVKYAKKITSCVKLVARICVVNENHASLCKYSPNPPVCVDVTDSHTIPDSV